MPSHKLHAFRPSSLDHLYWDSFFSVGSSAMILISALAAALLPCLPLLANAQARNTLNVQTYTPEQTTVKDTICELFQGSTRGGVWPETIHSPIDTWNLFEVTPKLVEYLEANGKDDFATNFIASATAGRVQRTSPIVCNTITDSCDVPFDCDGYDSFESALVVWSIYALRKSTDRQDAAYVEAHAKFAENDNDLAKVVFRDTQFGDDVKDIQRRLFIGAITNMFSFIGGVVGGSVIKGLFALIRETAKFLVKEAFSDFDIGNDPVNDGTAFVNSLQASYTEIRDLLKIIVENYMRNGDVDFALISTPQQTVEFLQSGAMLPLMSESALAAFKDKTRDDLIKQTALPFIASIYQEQGLRIRISNAVSPAPAPSPSLENSDKLVPAT
ncbi:hypothetical protein BU26DRAFT_294045 [Trematosphaeria pertusa]|uniref:Uncharacterized protein n=1 Tax=Trematosphaeria pertusa TaxID=390896 RepID=A0A6A6IJE2_9PLEO|nr:uncharacterized protein BU26DRAFT_294045 [Trematosphaeria pertusa]KAF2249992.1 hypothetical protein BU26DRAFT_294045 [Trematosphaeria pertusa]